jgi:hypothetical protein
MSQHSGYLDEMAGGGGKRRFSSSMHSDDLLDELLYGCNFHGVSPVCVGERIPFSHPNTWGAGSRIQIVPYLFLVFLVFQPRIRLEKFIADN